jgi:hypothetical protein
VVRCSSRSLGDIPAKLKITEMTGILIDGKMSFGVLKIERTPAIRIKIASTMKV